MAVEYYKLPGPTLLLSGPGTGKTYQLTDRIKYLIEEKKTPSDSITVITFTTHAARSMRRKISDPSKLEFIDPVKQPRRICTMHSLGYSILLEKPELIELGDHIRVVSSNSLRNLIIEDASQLGGFERKDGKDTVKRRQFGERDFLDDKDKIIEEKYRAILEVCTAVDHDDQILLALKILESEPDILEKYKLYCKHLLVDEYQDINKAQFELIKLLSAGQVNGLFVVGDDDQSIYSWRGGSPEFIRKFKDYFGESSKIESLNKSFRCSENIYKAGIAIVQKHDSERINKGPYTFKNSSDMKVHIHNAPSDEKEANIVCAIIKSAIPLKNVLVLVPHRGFLRAILGKLKAERVPFLSPAIFPGEGIPMIATIGRWLNNVSDNLALRELLDILASNPKLGIPSKRVRKPEKLKNREDSLLKFSLLWDKVISKESEHFWGALDKEKDKDVLYEKAHSMLSSILDLYNTQNSLNDFMSGIIDIFSPWKNIPEFFNEIDRWYDTLSQIGVEQDSSNVQLISFQGAKGLEAEVVCVLGVQDGVIPRHNIAKEDLSEQARLMFVTMTRASEELHLFHARKRSSNVMFQPVYAKGGSSELKPSEFVESIPDECKDVIFHRA